MNILPPTIPFVLDDGSAEAHDMATQALTHAKQIARTIGKTRGAIAMYGATLEHGSPTDQSVGRTYYTPLLDCAMSTSEAYVADLQRFAGRTGEFRDMIARNVYHLVRGK